MRAIDVAADEQDELVGESFAEAGHLLGKLILRALAGAGIAKDGELQRAGRVRQGHGLVGGRLLRGDRHRPDGLVVDAGESRRRDEYQAEELKTLVHAGLLGRMDGPVSARHD